MSMHATHVLKVLYYQMEVVLHFAQTEPMQIVVYVILATLHVNCALIILLILAKVAVMDTY